MSKESLEKNERHGAHATISYFSPTQIWKNVPKIVVFLSQ